MLIIATTPPVEGRTISAHEALAEKMGMLMDLINAITDKLS